MTTRNGGDEAGVAPDTEFGGRGTETGLPRRSGTGTFNASARAAAREAALGKRPVGSLMRHRRMIVVKAGGTCGLMSDGRGGAAWRCCVITAVGVSP